MTRVVLNNTSEEIIEPLVSMVLSPQLEYVSDSLIFDGEAIGMGGQGYFFGTGLRITDLRPGFAQELTFTVSVNGNDDKCRNIYNIASVKSKKLDPIHDRVVFKLAAI